MALVWGTHCVVLPELKRFSEMADKACRVALREDFAKAGDRIIITAGVPLGTPGSTNILRFAFIEE